MLRRPVRKNLAFLVEAFVTLTSLLRSCNGELSLASVARALPLGTSFKDRYKRLNRFLDNRLFDPQGVAQGLFGVVLGLRRRRGAVPVALDQSTVGEAQLLMAGVPFAGRVLPLGLMTFTYEDIRNRPEREKSQNFVERLFFLQLLEAARGALLCFILDRVLTKRRAQLEILERDPSLLEGIKRPFPRISYDEAVKRLQALGSEIQWGGDLGGGDETALSEQFASPVLVHRYPSAVKAFYMQPDPLRSDVALCVDVLAPEGYGEIIGGGQRIHNYHLLMKRIQENNLPAEAYQWYLDLRRYGTVPHAGFGMGIERVVAWLCKLTHLRETIAFPRTLYRIYP